MLTSSKRGPVCPRLSAQSPNPSRTNVAILASCKLAWPWGVVDVKCFLCFFVVGGSGGLIGDSTELL